MIRQTLLAASIATLFAGCAAHPTQQDNEARVSAKADEMRQLIDAISPQSAAPKVNDSTPPLDIAPLPPAKQQAIDRAWLRNRKVDFTPNRKNPAPIPAMEILKMFREHGINITSALPLDSYTYNGNGVKAADGESALQMILGQMGLDFDVDDKAKFITVVPMKSKSWNINLGNRTSYSSASSFEQMCQMGSQGNAGSNSGGAGMGSQPGGTMGGTSGAQTGGMGTSPTGSPSGTPGATGSPATAGAAQTSGSNVATSQNFWVMLNQELSQRLQVLIPVATNTPAQPGMNTPMVPGISGTTTPGMTTGGNALYTRQQIGHYSINPVTGDVTIQAPSWVLKQIGTYMDDVIMPMFNTSITFEGTVVNVRASKDQTTGIDLQALASYAGKYGFVLNNNILGGVTINNTGGIPSVNLGSGATGLPGGGVSFGMVSPKDNLQIFNGFLTTLGGSEVLTKPVVTVTSGVPADFGRLTPIYTNEQTSSLTPGTVNSGALATVQNNIVERKYGSLLRIMPHFDPKTRRVRAQISLLQKPLVGYQTLPITIAGAGGSLQLQTIRIPQIECGVTSTEAILDDGELIVIGGQVENTNDNNHNGITGAMEVPGLGLITSQRRDAGNKTTMYFALRVRLTTKPTPATHVF